MLSLREEIDKDKFEELIKESFSQISSARITRLIGSNRHYIREMLQEQIVNN